MLVKVEMQMIVNDETLDTDDVEIYVQDLINEEEEFAVVNMRAVEIHEWENLQNRK